MYPYFNNQNQIPNFPVYNSSFPQTSPRLVCRQVGSIEEAKSAIIDPISLYLFVDFSSGKIYVKKMGDNGQSEFYQYAQVAEPKPVDPMDEIRQRLSNRVYVSSFDNYDASFQIFRRSNNLEFE